MCYFSSKKFCMRYWIKVHILRHWELGVLLKTWLQHTSRGDEYSEKLMHGAFYTIKTQLQHVQLFLPDARWNLPTEDSTCCAWGITMSKCVTCLVTFPKQLRTLNASKLREEMKKRKLQHKRVRALFGLYSVKFLPKSQWQGRTTSASASPWHEERLTFCPYTRWPSNVFFTHCDVL